VFKYQDSPSYSTCKVNCTVSLLWILLFKGAKHNLTILSNTDFEFHKQKSKRKTMDTAS